MTIRTHFCKTTSPLPIVDAECSNTLSTAISPSQHQAWLNEYYRLREESFRRELGIPRFKGDQDKFDHSGYIVLLVADGNCVGGARINDNGIGGGKALPIEEDGFSLRDIFPQLSRPGVRYCQWTRLVIHPAYRNTEVLKAMAEALTTLSDYLGQDYSFNVSGNERARLYRKLYRNQGIRYEIRKEIDLPSTERAFDHLEHLLSVVYGSRVNDSLVYQPNTVLVEPQIAVEEDHHSGPIMAVA